MSEARLTWLITRRELREGVRGKTFLISTLVMLLILGAVITLPSVFGTKTIKLAVAGHVPAALVRDLQDAGKSLDRTVSIRRYPSAAAARDAVAHRDVDAALVAGGHTLVTRPSPDAVLIAAATAAARSAFLAEHARAIGITPEQARAALASPLAVREVSARGADKNAQPLAFFMSIALFLSVSIFGQSVLTGVVQEKASRIPEVLIAAVRPWQLLAGKVAGIGLLGLAQIVILLAGAVGANAFGAIHLPTLGRTAPLAFVAFVLGFTLYAVAFAAAGALASRIEDLSSVATPISMTMLTCYLASIGALSNPSGKLAVVLSLLPISSPLTMPGRAAQTPVPAWQYAAALVLMLAAIWALIRIGGRIYELGLLRSGPRVRFREAFAGLRG